MVKKTSNQVSEQIAVYTTTKKGKLSEEEKQAILAHIDKIAGSSKRLTTDEERHEIGEKAFAELQRRIRNNGMKPKISAKEKQELFKHIESLRGISKRKTTDEERHEIRERTFLALEKKNVEKRKSVKTYSNSSGI